MSDDYILFEGGDKAERAATSIADAIRLGVIINREKNPSRTISEKEILYYLNSIYSKEEIQAMTVSTIVNKTLSILLVESICPQHRLRVTGTAQILSKKVRSVIVAVQEDVETV